MVPPAGAGRLRAGPAVAAVVVSYNSRRYLERCLDSLAAEGVERVVVVDNGSTDGSRQMVAARGQPGPPAGWRTSASAAGTWTVPVEWVDAGANLGYGRAANLGASRPSVAGAGYLLICNPDLVLHPGSVAALARVLDEDPGAGLVGPRIVNSDGTLYPSARTFPDLLDAIGHGLFGLVMPGNRFTRRYRLLDWDHSQRADVDWVSGACVLVRRPAWDAAGGFDPSYFMYMEDVDLCWRLGRAGWRVVYEPAATVLHFQGVSADLHPYRMLAAHHRSLWIFARRTTTGWRRLALPVVAAGLLARLGVACARRLVAGRRPGRP